MYCFTMEKETIQLLSSRETMFGDCLRIITVFLHILFYSLQIMHNSIQLKYTVLQFSEWVVSTFCMLISTFPYWRSAQFYSSHLNNCSWGLQIVLTWGSQFSLRIVVKLSKFFWLFQGYLTSSSSVYDKFNPDKYAKM